MKALLNHKLSLSSPNHFQHWSGVCLAQTQTRLALKQTQLSGQTRFTHFQNEDLVGLYGKAKLLSNPSKQETGKPSHTHTSLPIPFASCQWRCIRCANLHATHKCGCWAKQFWVQLSAHSHLCSCQCQT